MQLSRMARDSVVADSILSGNTAGTRGGALVASRALMTFTNTSCSNNDVLLVSAAGLGRTPSPYDRIGVGGCAVIEEGSEVSWTASDIHGNAAVQGGGLHVHCGGELSLFNVSFLRNAAGAAGKALSFECPSPWLQHETLNTNRVELPQSEPLILGSGPTSLNIVDRIPALFEGRLEVNEAVLTVALLDVNGAVVTTDNNAYCDVTAFVPGDPAKQPGLLASTRYQARRGMVEVTPFGVTARDTEVIGIHVRCKDSLTVSTVVDFAEIVPQWLEAPAPVWQWVPSSGPVWLPLLPEPAIVLSMPPGQAYLLADILVVCTVKAQNMKDGSVVPLLNPPADGYSNADGNWSVVPLPGLAIDAGYGTAVQLQVQCDRERDRLDSVSATVLLSPPGMKWNDPPAPSIASGTPFPMAVELRDVAFPAANATSCTAAVDEQGDGAFVRGNVAVMVDGIALWKELVMVAPLNSMQRLRVNCSTGYHRIPTVLSVGVRVRDCPAGSEPSETRSGCISCTGTTYSRGGLEPCRGCPPSDGATCDAGTLRLHDGFYPASSAYLSSPPDAEASQQPPMSRATVLYRCDVPGACFVRNASGGYYCGIGYTGPLCGVCAPGYAKAGLYCSQCWPPWLSILIIGIGAVIGLAALGYIALFRKGSKPTRLAIIIRIGLSYVQMLSSLGQFRAKATEMVQQALGMADAVGNSVLSTGPLQCTFRLSYYSRFGMSISLPFVVGGLVVLIATAGIAWRHFRYCRRCGRHTAGFQEEDSLDFDATSTTTPPSPPSPAQHPNELNNAAKPIIGNRHRGIALRAACQSFAQDFLQYFREKSFLGPILFVYFFFYNSIINTLASIYRCREETIDGQQFLEVDLSVRCADGAHISGMVAAAVLALLLNVLFPLALIVTLRRNRAHLDSPTMQRRYGFLYMGYSTARGLYWWEAVVLLRKFAVLMVASSISDPFYQSLLGVSVIVTFFVVQVNYQPYEDRTLNRLEMMVMACLCFTQVVSLAYFRASALQLPDDSQVQVDLAVTCLLALANGACLITLGVCGWLSLRRQRRSNVLKRRGLVGSGAKDRKRGNRRTHETPATPGRSQLRPMALGPSMNEDEHSCTKAEQSMTSGKGKVHWSLRKWQPAADSTVGDVADQHESHTMVWNYPWKWRAQSSTMPRWHLRASTHKNKASPQSFD